MTKQIPVSNEIVNKNNQPLHENIRAHLTCKMTFVYLTILSGVYFWFQPEHMEIVLDVLWSIIY
ncbi:MAG: hypothetical protein HRT54_02950 [Colwellia sp.]|nr:hypothetical protein [Colwellia sp.]